MRRAGTDPAGPDRRRRRLGEGRSRGWRPSARRWRARRRGWRSSTRAALAAPARRLERATGGGAAGAESAQMSTHPPSRHPGWPGSWRRCAPRCGCPRGSAQGRRGSVRRRRRARAHASRRVASTVRADLRGEPITLLRHRAEVAHLPAQLEQLGDDDARPARRAVARRRRRSLRPGRPAGPRAAHGRDTPLRPRVPGEVLEEIAGAPGVGLRRAAGARARAARRPPARARRASRAHAARVVLGERSSRAAHGASASSSASRSPTRLGCASRSVSGCAAAGAAESLRLAPSASGPRTPGARALFEDRSASGRAAARGDAPGARGRGPGGGAARAGRRPGLTRPGAPHGADAVRVVDVPAARGVSTCPAARVCPGPGGRPLDVDGHEVDRRARVVAGRGSLVDGRAAAAALLGGRDDRRAI